MLFLFSLIVKIFFLSQLLSNFPFFLHLSRIFLHKLKQKIEVHLKFMEITLYKNFSACVTSCVVCVYADFDAWTKLFSEYVTWERESGLWTTGCQHKFSSTLHFVFGYFFLSPSRKISLEWRFLFSLMFSVFEGGFEEKTGEIEKEML